MIPGESGCGSFIRCHTEYIKRRLYYNSIQAFAVVETV